MTVEHTPYLCPFSLRWYAALLLLPLGASAVMVCGSPFSTWMVLVTITFWFEALLDQQASGTGSASWQRGLPLFEYLLLLPLASGLYLIGPAHVIRAPPWQQPYFASSFPRRNKHVLPAPAKTPRELVTRNLVCFLVPMLLGCHLESTLSDTVFSTVSLSPGAVDNFLRLGPARTLLLLALAAGGGYAAAINVVAIARAGGLARLGVVYAAMVACVVAVTLCLRGFHALHVHHYIFFAALAPLGATDSHFGAASQGLVLGIAMQGIARYGPATLWPYSPPPTF